jgi:hypothetical protein
MKISNFEVEQKALSTFNKTERSELTVQTFTVNQPAVSLPEQSSNFIALSLSEERFSLTEANTDELFHLSEADHVKIRMIEDFIATLTGKKFKFKQVVKLDEASQEKMNVKHASDNNGLHLGHAIKPTFTGVVQGQFGMRITAKHEVHEAENLSFQSKGVVNTADGKTIEFKVNLEMKRAYTQTSEVLIEIGAKLQDPLVINYDGKGIALGEDSIELDITMDGTPEQFRNLAAGSGFLALDKNNNGIIDDGSELFGPETGSGFGELAVYDQDNNGWIDESDDIFTSLKLWTVTPSGQKTLVGIKDADIGAIYLGKVASDFQIKNGSELLAKIRETSVYLKENGGAGTIHEIDLKI